MSDFDEYQDGVDAGTPETASALLVLNYNIKKELQNIAGFLHDIVDGLKKIEESIDGVSGEITNLKE